MFLIQMSVELLLSSSGFTLFRIISIDVVTVFTLDLGPVMSYALFTIFHTSAPFLAP